MKVAILSVVCLAACVSGGLVAGPSVLVRTPSLDSAIIQSDRLGGNFAYSSVEGHAYAAITPVVQNVVRPVAVTYTAHQVPVGAVALGHPGLVHVAHGPSIIPGIGHSFIPGSGVLFAAPASPVAADAPASSQPAAEAPASGSSSSSNDAVEVESA